MLRALAHPSDTPAAMLGGPFAPPLSPLKRSARLAQALAARLHADLVETHASWIVLDRRHALRIRKPLRLPDGDASTLALRRQWAEEQMRLQASPASGMLLGVREITGSPEAPGFAPGQPIEVALHMRRFPASAPFSARVASGRLEDADIDALAAVLARFHLQASPAGPLAGIPSQRLARCQEALAAAAPALTLRERCHLEDWIAVEAGRAARHWHERQRAGRVRDCHGALHLGNVLRMAKGLRFVDAAATADARCMDVVEDLALPVAELVSCDRADLAFRLLDGWLDATGDHSALPILRLAAACQSLRRAAPTALHGPGRHAASRRHAAAALGWRRRGLVQLTVIHGPAGPDTARMAQHLQERQRAVRIRWTVEQQRVRRAEGLRAATAERVLSEMLNRARLALESGYCAILDGEFLRRHERERARALARGCDAQFVIASWQPPGAEDEEDGAEDEVRAAPGSGSGRPSPLLEPVSGPELDFLQCYRSFLGL